MDNAVIRSYDIFSIENRIYELEQNGGGGSAEMNDLSVWLSKGGVVGTYDNLAEVLADTDALALLMASEDAVKYMINCTDWIIPITSNSNACTALGANPDNASLVIDSQIWVDYIAKGGYADKIFAKKIPTMTSDTTPSGTCSAKDTYSGYPAYYAFDNDETTEVASSTSGTPWWVKYTFAEAITAKVFKIVNRSSAYITQYKLQGTNDSTWVDLGTYTNGAGNTTQTFSLDNSTAYKSYRVYVTANDGNGNGAKEIQIYGV